MKGNVYLKLVNASSLALPIHIALDGVNGIGSKADLFTLSGTGATDTNSIDAPTRIVPVKREIHTGSAFEHTMAPYSIEVIVLATM